MSKQCKLCGLHVMDGATTCMMCGNKDLAVATAGQTITPSLPGAKSLGASQPGFSKWLIVVAISLALTPIFRLSAILNVEVPTLYGDQGQGILASHPGLAGLLYFEIVMNSVLIASALVLNFLFYTKRKIFPLFMVGYVATTVLFLVAVTAVINSQFPDANLTRSYISLVRSLIWAGAMIPYLLTASEIKSRFVK